MIEQIKQIHLHMYAKSYAEIALSTNKMVSANLPKCRTLDMNM